MDDLRERLATEFGRGFNAGPLLDAQPLLMQMAAGGLVDTAVPVVAQWLRDEAAELRRAEPHATGSIRHHLIAGADRLEILARALTHPNTTEQP